MVVVVVVVVEQADSARSRPSRVTTDDGGRDGSRAGLYRHGRGGAVVNRMALLYWIRDEPP